MVPSSLWVWSRQQRPNRMAKALGPRVGGSPGPWCSPGAGTGWDYSLEWDCSRGPTFVVGLLQEGRGGDTRLGGLRGRYTRLGGLRVLSW